MKYETNRKYLLVFGALLIGYSLLGISFDGQIPFVNIKLEDKGRISLVMFVVVLYFFVYTVYTWLRLSKEKRSKFDLAVCVNVGLLAMIPTVIWIFNLIDITWSKALLAFGLLLSGIIFGVTFSFLVAIVFSLRSSHEMKKLGLGRVPTASKAFLRALNYFLIPVDILLIAGIVLWRSFFPKPLDTYWWPFVFCPLFCLNIDILFNILLCIGPSSVRQRAFKRLRWFRGPMDIHEMHYQQIGLEPIRQYEQPDICKLAWVGQNELLRILLSNGQDPNKQTGRGWSPLMLASAEGHLSAVDILLSNGANPNAENYLGRTALMYASRYGYFDIARKLIEHGADVNPIHEVGKCPPLLAAAEYGHCDVVSLLVEKGADLYCKNKDGKTALDLAMGAGHGEVAKMLRVSMRKMSSDANPDPLPPSLRWIEKELEDEDREPIHGKRKIKH